MSKSNNEARPKQKPKRKKYKLATYYSDITPEELAEELHLKYTNTGRVFKVDHKTAAGLIKTRKILDEHKQFFASAGITDLDVDVLTSVTKDDLYKMRKHDDKIGQKIENQNSFDVTLVSNDILVDENKITDNGTTAIKIGSYKAESGIKINDSRVRCKATVEIDKTSDPYNINIAFRGSCHFKDIVMALFRSTKKHGMHEGYYKALKPTLQAIMNALQKQKINIAQCKYNFTGFSMGGALAEMSAFMLARGDLENINLPPENLKVCAFAPPGCFSREAAKKYGEKLGDNTLSLTFGGDSVTGWISKYVLRCKKVGTEIELGAGGGHAVFWDNWNAVDCLLKKKNLISKEIYKYTKTCLDNGGKVEVKNITWYSKFSKPFISYLNKTIKNFPIKWKAFKSRKALDGQSKLNQSCIRHNKGKQRQI